MRNILTNAFGYIRLLKGEVGMKKKIDIIPDIDLKVNIEFAHLKRKGLNLQKSYPELIYFPTMKRRFHRRTYKVGGLLPVPIHYNY